MTQWVFDAPLGDLGPSHVYPAIDDPAALVTAAAFGPGAPHLTAQRAGPDDIGLGLTSSPDGEITPGSFVQFDLSAAHLTGHLGFQASSTDGGDVWHVLGTNTPATLAGAVSIKTGSGAGPIDLGADVAGAWHYLDVTAELLLPDGTPSGNGTVLVRALGSESPLAAIPEPATLLLLATGLLALAWFNTRPLRRRR